MKITFTLGLWFFFISFIISSESDDNEEDEFIPLPNTVTRINEPSTITTSKSSTITNANVLDEVLLDESVSLSLNCETSLGSSEEALKSFVMKSLDFTSDETLEDLERPTCRAFFDRNGHHLSKEQINQLMASERGQRILEESEVLEFFSDFSEFTLKDFDRFPSLQVGKIRNLASIPAEVLLTLVKGRGYIKAGKLERIPEAFGERIFEHESWRLDPEIWQIFTLEGIAQIHSVSLVEKFSNFISELGKFERLIFSFNDDDHFEDFEEKIDLDFTRLRSSTISSDNSIRSTAQTALTSTKICKSIAKYSNLFTRWAVQSEELFLYLIELPEISRDSSPHLSSIQNSVNKLIKTRLWLKKQVKDRCGGATEISDSELFQLTNFKTILETPLAWRLKEAIRLSINQPADGDVNATPMTKNLQRRLTLFPTLIDFYRPTFRSASTPAQNDLLLTHFFLVNKISNLETIFEGEPVNLIASNEKLVLSIALRRILLLLLSPSIEPSNAIQDALNYVFSTRSPLLSTSDSNEIVRWFRQAQDLQVVPVLDRLIRSFGHEFDVVHEIRSILNNRPMRIKLFTEAQSAFVRLLTALSNGLSEHLIDEAPKVLVLPYLDPANALLKNQIPDLPQHPSRQRSQEEITEHAHNVEQVREHNAAIAKTLEISLAFLQTFTVDPVTLDISQMFSGFIQPNFAINFDDKVGIDAGGLRRTWLSALLRIFGDPQRMLFPLHLELGGRTPSALLAPAIMSHLGALHGKALQIGVKPDWFFSRRYTQSLLFARTAPEADELAQLVEELFPDIFGVLDLIAQMESEQDAVDYFNYSEFPTIEGLTTDEIVTTTVNDDNNGPMTQTVNNGPPRHSFSRMLVFDVRFLAQESIYNRDRQSITSLHDLSHYRSSLLTFLTSNLLQGVQAYWRTFGIFFDTQFRYAMEPKFLHDLLEPPVVTIEDILTRVQFHRSCDSIFLIDDEIEADGADAEINIDDTNVNSENNRSAPNSPYGSISKKPRSSPAKISNITAQTALTRILSSSFTSPETISSLLSFATGCPQVPPAGLDALRLSVHCYPATSPETKLSKSHTCTNLIDFNASMHYMETKEAFLLSALSSSGFGFA